MVAKFCDGFYRDLKKFPDAGETSEVSEKRKLIQKNLLRDLESGDF